MRVVVVGSTNIDLVATAPTLPRPGETVLGDTFSSVPGGKGANQAIAAARAGAESCFIGAVGDDRFADQLRESLASEGVDLRLLRSVPGPSGVALITVDSEAENSIVVVPGANGRFTALTDADRAVIAGATAVLLQLEIPLSTVIEAARVARAAGVPVLLNAAPAQSLPTELLAATDLLIVNTLEAEIILGYADSSARLSPSASARGMLAYGLLEELRRIVPKVVLTVGPDGVYYTDQKGGWLHVPAPRVDAVDTTAAGDAFVGALAVALGAGKSIGPALSWACAAGAICATRAGASRSLATFAEIDRLAAR
jgi:ribokinase